MGPAQEDVPKLLADYGHEHLGHRGLKCEGHACGRAEEQGLGGSLTPPSESAQCEDQGDSSKRLALGQWPGHSGCQSLMHSPHLTLTRLVAPTTMWEIESDVWEIAPISALFDQVEAVLSRAHSLTTVHWYRQNRGCCVGVRPELTADRRRTGPQARPRASLTPPAGTAFP